MDENYMIDLEMVILKFGVSRAIVELLKMFNVGCGQFDDCQKSSLKKVMEDVKAICMKWKPEYKIQVIDDDTASKYGLIAVSGRNRFEIVYFINEKGEPLLLS